MPFPRSTLSQLRQQVATDINAALPGVDALLRYSNLGILGDVLAALASGHYGYLDWIALNSVPFTATGEYLEGWAALKGVVRKAATPAAGTATFPCTAGAVVPVGTVVSRTDGTSYFSTAAAIGVGGTVVVPIQAVEGGTTGNAGIGVQVLLSAGISGVTAKGTASSALTGGVDIETDADLRSRMLDAYATPPQGGSITDYPGWALAVPGVTRCWVKPSAMGPGTIVLLFMMDEAHAGQGGFPQGTNGCSIYETRDTPASGDQLTVANAVFGRQSVTALVYAVAPIPNIIAFTFSGLAGASDDTKAGIVTAIQTAFRVNAVPGGITNISTIETAIAAVPETAGFVITGMACSLGTIQGGAVGNILSNEGTLPILGGITYS